MSPCISPQSRKLTVFLKEQDIGATSYMTLAYGKVLKDPVLAQIANKHQATVAQVALAWALQQGYAAIPRRPDAKTSPAIGWPATCGWMRTTRP